MMSILTRSATVFAAALMLAAAPAGAQDAAVDNGPLRGFVYVEPFEIRSELTVRLACIAAPEAQPLDEGMRARVLESVRTELIEACRVLIDDVRLPLDAKELTFIALDPEKGPQPDEREFIPWDDALIGVTLAAARPGFPEAIDVEWSLFPAACDAGSVPVTVQVRSGETVHESVLDFTPASARQTWALPEVAPPPQLVEIPSVVEAVRRAPSVVAGSFGSVAVVLALLALFGRAYRRSLALSAGLVLLVAALALYDLRSRPTSRMPEAHAVGLVEGLLTNIYHAFAFRDESVIFDTLATSVDGPLLEQVYLDIRRGLELEERGGARVKVLRVAIVDCAVLQSDARGVRARVVWTSTGDVSHWGHTHRRRNQYRGEFRIEAIDGAWKVTGVDILEEERT